MRDIHKSQSECFNHLIWIRRQLTVLNLKTNVLLYILSFNECVQMVPVDSGLLTRSLIAVLKKLALADLIL